MKNQHVIKNSLIYSGILSITLFGMISCTNSQKTEDTKEMAEEHNEQKFDSNREEKDAQFLVNAAEIHLEEIQLSQIAQSNSTEPEVKKMGKIMESDHTKSLNDLKELASKKSITIPTSLTEDNKDAYKDLSNKSGEDFDKEYCEKMVEGHKKAIEKFEDASAKSEDAEIRAWAEASLPVLRSHLDHALTCQNKIEKK